MLDATLAVAAIYVALTLKVTAGEVMGEPIQAKPERTGPREARDVVLITALASGATQANAGRAAGMSDRTVRRRLADPEFAARVAAEGKQVASRAAARSARWPAAPPSASWKSC